MAALFSTRLGRQASGYLQDKYKQARLALGDITPAELYACSFPWHLNNVM
jgi:epsin